VAVTLFPILQMYCSMNVLLIAVKRSVL